jgi:hypothetical protein
MKSESQLLEQERRIMERTTAHVVLTFLANAYIECVCYDPWLPEVKRHWTIRRTVDYSGICLQ